jgi:hypothetical protein
LKTGAFDGEVRLPRFENKGRAYVYVLPRLGEDQVKLGFSRDPFERFRTLHPQFHAFFDLDQGLLVELDSIKEARRIERLFIERWPEHRCSAPLEVSSQAGGCTEWFRGISEHADVFAQRIAERYGYQVHRPLKRWLHQRMSGYADALFDWSLQIVEIIEWQECNVPEHARDGRFAIALKGTLDALSVVGVNTHRRLPPAVQRWYSRQLS